jgi:hypothetical protein
MFKSISSLTRGQKLFLLLWILLLLVVGITADIVITTRQRESLQASIKNHMARIDPNVTESGKTEPERTPPAGHENDIPSDVKIGLYMDRIPALSIRDSSWTADFYLWFNWTDDNLHPGDTFQIVDGEILKREKQEEKTVNGMHYALYRVTARTTKIFNTSRFPRDDHLLTLSFEDTSLQSYQLRYIADDVNSSISSRVKVPGYKIYQTSTVVKPHSYKTTRGDPELPEGYKATYSQFIYGIWLARPNWGLHFKMFITLFAAITISMVGFFTSPAQRFGLVIGSFFAAVANTYVTASVVPDTGIATLADVINGIGVALIALIMFQTIISNHFYDKKKQETFSDVFDDLTFAVLLALYIWLNISIPLAASLPL